VEPDPALAGVGSVGCLFCVVGCFMSKNKVAVSWQDREVLFDINPKLLACRPGEEIVETLSDVEDSKGSNNEVGKLVLTNLRCMWIFNKDKKINLTFGLDTIRKISAQDTASTSAPTRTVLTISAKFKEGRYEFIFSSANTRATKVCKVLNELYKSYTATRLFRDLKLRGAFVKNKRLNVLPGESIIRKISGVWNLSADQGNLGTFFITNVRIIWFAEMAENFNISIPYMQLTSIVLRTSKFGNALVMQTSSFSGNYTLGFRIDPQSLLKTVYQEMMTLFNVFSKKPNFGVVYTPKSRSDRLTFTKDDVQIVSTDQMEHFDTLTRYYADPGKGMDRKPVYDETLGLAVEETKANFSISQLWAVIV